MEENWRHALGKMTYGIYVLTTFYKQEINGMIASWVSQVSYDPLMMMAAVHPNRYSHGLIEQSGCFALHVPAKGQSDFLHRFKGPDPRKKFSSLAWRRGTTGCPVIEDCLAWFECRVIKTHRPGNHTLFLGEVVAAGTNGGGDPLSSLDYDGIYQGRF
jgi:flavin reductase (DIM6/NTAB) family NADH-FMN oxidoreductase RutF